MKKKLPIGIENFEEIRKEGFYYIDKTGLIKELLDNWGKVNLFTRPRRFGKTLNMSMLKYFFEPGGDKGVFDGLKILQETALCEEYMGKYPTIFISLKGINAESYESALDMTVQTVNREARRHQYLLDSKRLTGQDKTVFSSLLQMNMDTAELCCSLYNLSELLSKHYGSKVMILIDEYDVPLAKAFEQGYYDKMVLLLRNLFEHTLKTNDCLQFAVLSGCLRIAKESIFTGLNNIKVLSIADVEFDEYFGFTDAEVRNLLAYYGVMDKYDTVKEWYDGYHFGNVDVYCPWDVLCYCDKLRADKDAEPGEYWTNTSSNDVVRRIVEKAEAGSTKREMEKLLVGEAVVKEIHQELTYKDLYNSIDNIWSVLFTTGYLTRQGKAAEKGSFRLVIPNREIREIFAGQVMELFKENVKKDGSALNAFCESLKGGDAKGVERQLTAYLQKTISIRDSFAPKYLKENFYHGILLGILGFKEEWTISSNRESGNGYSDILVEPDGEKTGIVIEIKYAENGRMEEECRKALKQIEDRQYEQQFREEGMHTILKYGIACYKKQCWVEIEQSSPEERKNEHDNQ